MTKTSFSIHPAVSLFSVPLGPAWNPTSRLCLGIFLESVVQDPGEARKGGISGSLLYKCSVKRSARVTRKEYSPIRRQAKFFRGLADASRLSILAVLREGRKTVTEVAREAHLSQPNASMHLNCLWECGLVEREVGRRNTFYWIGSRDVVRLLEMGVQVLGSVKDRIAAGARFCED